MADIRVKVCGLKTAQDVAAAAEAGANYIGLNFFPKSPRYVTPSQARDLAIEAPVGLAKVALLVDADNDTLDAIVQNVPLDMVQLHGSETPSRVAEIRVRTRLPVMKVFGVAEAADLTAIDAYLPVIDQIMIDAKPPKGAVLPGGNGLAFDWQLVAGKRWSKPWMLAGGLTPDNVGDAVALTGVQQVDVASGVEDAPGVKSAAKMAAFCKAARVDAPPRL